jgi:hypothetical protein
MMNNKECEINNIYRYTGTLNTPWVTGVGEALLFDKRIPFSGEGEKSGIPAKIAQTPARFGITPASFARVPAKFIITPANFARTFAKSVITPARPAGISAKHSGKPLSFRGKRKEGRWESSVQGAPIFESLN